MNVASHATADVQKHYIQVAVQTTPNIGTNSRNCGKTWTCLGS